MRDAFFASPLFPRLLDGDLVKDAIARGVSTGILAYVAKAQQGYSPFVFVTGLASEDVEISEDMFIIGNMRASTIITITKQEAPSSRPEPPKPTEIKGLRWSGEVPAQKWMNFYTKVLAKFVTSGGLKLRVTFEVSPEGGLLPQRIEETEAVLRELGMDGGVERIS